MSERVVLDTMAWWEILWGTPAGARLEKRYLGNGVLVHASALAIGEVSAKLHAAGHGARVDDALLGIRAAARIEPVTDDLAEEGGRLRAELREKDAQASLADAIQLATARTLGARLVSSDPAFKGQRDVEAF